MNRFNDDVIQHFWKLEQRKPGLLDIYKKNIVFRKWSDELIIRQIIKDLLSQCFHDDWEECKDQCEIINKGV